MRYVIEGPAKATFRIWGRPASESGPLHLQPVRDGCCVLLLLAAIPLLTVTSRTLWMTGHFCPCPLPSPPIGITPPSSYHDFPARGRQEGSRKSCPPVDVWLPSLIPCYGRPRRSRPCPTTLGGLGEALLGAGSMVVLCLCANVRICAAILGGHVPNHFWTRSYSSSGPRFGGRAIHSPFQHVSDPHAATHSHSWIRLAAAAAVAAHGAGDDRYGEAG